MSNFATEGTFASKKAFAEHVKANGADSVMVIDTSAFNNRGIVKVSALEPADVIVGPDAYRDRRWYANAKPKKNRATGQTTIVIA